MKKKKVWIHLLDADWNDHDGQPTGKDWQWDAVFEEKPEETDPVYYEGDEYPCEWYIEHEASEEILAAVESLETQDEADMVWSWIGEHPSLQEAPFSPRREVSDVV